MNQFLECDQFQDHRRAICRGERIDLPLDTVNKYRVLWGLEPLPVDFIPIASPSVSSSPSEPPLAQRVVTFAAAMTNHVRDGMTKCDEPEIQSRLEVCQQCPSFTGTHCRECGCACSQKKTFFNKLAWRSERCPLGRW